MQLVEIIGISKNRQVLFLLEVVFQARNEAIKDHSSKNSNKVDLIFQFDQSTSFIFVSKSLNRGSFFSDGAK